MKLLKKISGPLSLLAIAASLVFFLTATPVFAENAYVNTDQGLAGEIVPEQSPDDARVADEIESAFADGEISRTTSGNSAGEVIGAAEAAGDGPLALAEIDQTVASLSSGLEKSVVTSLQDEVLNANDPRAAIAALQSFVDSVSNGSRAVTGIYVKEGFSLRVGQQPSGSPGYVSNNLGEVTQFGMAAKYGSKGFLAHNYLSGASFFDLSVGMVFSLVYGDGSTEKYQITEIRSFEALQPNSPYSNFVDLDQGGKLSATKLFHSIYNYENPVVLQTCIENHGISTWGRLFIIAVPVSG